MAIGAVYATLERLEIKGYVTSTAGDPTPERGGRAKRFFRVHTEGRRVLRESREAIGKMIAGLDTALEVL